MGGKFCSDCGHQVDGAKFCSECGSSNGSSESATTTLPVDFGTSTERDAPDWGGRFERAISFRVGCLSLLCGSMVAALLGHFLWHSESVTGWVTLIIAGLLWFGAVMNDDQAMKCPRCRKRVKIGADTCHHCGTFTARS